MVAASGLHMRSRTGGARAARWIAWAIAVAYLALGLTALALEWTLPDQPILMDVLVVLAVLGCAVIGALIIGRDPSHPIGWMFSAAALSFGAAFFSRQYAVQALAMAPGSLPAGETFAWLSFWIDIPGIAVVALFLPLLFPDGHLPSPRWRLAGVLAAVGVLCAVAAAMLAPDDFGDAGFPQVRNPLGLTAYAGAFDLIWGALQPLLLVLVIVSLAALLARVRRADPEQRQQIKWFGYAGTLVLASFIVEFLARAFPSLEAPRDLLAIAGLVAVPIAVGIAILRYRLYDIDVIVNRTVVYVLLTAVLAGFYTGAVALFQRVFVAATGQGSDLAIVMTLFVLATVFTPIKNTLQENVDRYVKPAKPGVRAAARAGELDDLIKLADLHRDGILTDEEFAAKKKQVLGI